MPHKLFEYINVFQHLMSNLFVDNVLSGFTKISTTFNLVLFAWMLDSAYSLLDSGRNITLVFPNLVSSNTAQA